MVDMPLHPSAVAERHEFAMRMMNKPRPMSLNSDPAHRIFHDPPELIQIAFGGREWFHAMDNHTVHRIGLTVGLGWQFGEWVRKQLTIDVNGVQIKARTSSGGAQMYDIYFVHSSHGEDTLDPVKTRIVAHRGPLMADQLKSAYAEVLGAHAV